MDSGGGGGGGGSTADDLDTPDSWEVADLDASLSKLKLDVSLKQDSSSSSSSRFPSSYSAPDLVDDLRSSSGLGSGSGSSLSSTGVEKAKTVSEELINQVDQFLREAIQNPRERLSVLRMEQDVEKFIRDPTRQQLEFQHLPTSYLRLAAHRVAQHYSLQSMVLLDNNMPDGSDSRIIIRKTSECRLPLVRLADIPVALPTEESSAVKVAIKQRAQRRSHGDNTGNSHSSKSNNAKSVEERKEEYNRARARIFSSGSGSSGATVGKADIEPRMQDTIQHGFLGMPKREERSVSGGFDVNAGRGLIESSTGSSSSRAAKVRVEKEPIGRNHSNSRVAIFRDREIDRKDPDYDRNYDRYLQRFDPGFGFNGGPYTVQPMYTPAVNYNSEFPQLGPAHRPQISAEHQTRPIPQHLPGGPGQWISTSNNAGISYGRPEAMITQFNPNRVGGRSTPAVYLQHSQYPCHQPMMPYIHPHEHVHQPYSQSHQQQQPDGSFGMARPR